ncbi:hydrogen peroxide-inducible genes activator [Zobellella taiwanensis]|jgi:LysR family hydrogen peroxide-inducible transcriptional activator|uniref:LysR family transcriptional regulator n=1 Tax=Zobellella taiwanensis TaxID=347535 RepID=A0A2P7R5R1_9GAMM|nr:hydrogen peroxide-inducible genes activator [Zobellella taiwanensis]PSJ45537.1 LysR family transcriptional regulator [Zobellella taiwanensis]
MSRWPSLKQLTYLVALDEHQNFNRAAKACFVSQSTLSSGLQNLEGLLGGELIERDHKAFVMTPLGRQVVARARELLAQTRDLMELVEGQKGAMKGAIRLGCIPTIAPFLLSRLVQSCRDRYPDLDLLLREDTTSQLLAMLRSGELDLLLLALPTDTEGLRSRVIGQDPFVLVMHQEQAGDFAQPVDYRRLPDHSIFLLEQEHCLTEHAVSACRLTDRRKINPFAATSLHTLVQMVGAGLGSTFLPRMAIDAGILANTDILAMAPQGDKAYRDIGLVWRPTATRVETFYRLGDLVAELL